MDESTSHWEWRESGDGVTGCGQRDKGQRVWFFWEWGDTVWPEGQRVPENGVVLLGMG